MDNGTLLSIIAIVIAIFARPLELIWEKVLANKQKALQIIIQIIARAIGYGFSLKIIIEAWPKPFDKGFVLEMCLGFALLLFNLLIDLAAFLYVQLINHRIEVAKGKLETVKLEFEKQKTIAQIIDDTKRKLNENKYVSSLLTIATRLIN